MDEQSNEQEENSDEEYPKKKPIPQDVEPILDDSEPFEERAYLLDYPIDKIFTHSLFRWLIIPEGFRGYKLRVGKEEWGKELNDGLRFMFSLGGLVSSVAVVDTRVRTSDLTCTNVSTRDYIELPKVDSVLNWHVSDVPRAIFGAKDFKKTTEEIANARVIDYVSKLKLEDILVRNFEGRNLALRLPDDSGHREEYRPNTLKKVGTRLDSIYLTKVDLPDELRVYLAKETLAERDAKARVAIAKHQKDIADANASAAQAYAGTPEAFRIYLAEAAKEIGGGLHYIPGLEYLPEILKGLIPQREALPPHEPPSENPE